MSKPMTIRYKARHGDDPLAILKAISAAAAEHPDREVRAHIDTTDPKGRAASAQAEPKKPVPDEPMETELVASGNKLLEEKREEMRAKGVDPDQRRAEDAATRLAKRERLRLFRKWCADKFGGATVVIVVRSLWEHVKDKVG